MGASADDYNKSFVIFSQFNIFVASRARFAILQFSLAASTLRRLIKKLLHRVSLSFSLSISPSLSLSWLHLLVLFSIEITLAPAPSAKILRDK